MLRFIATLILFFSTAISAFFTVRFMMQQGASSEVDMALNMGIGLILCLAEVAFSMMIVTLYKARKYFAAVLFFVTSIPLIITSILASNLHLLDSRSKTEHQAMVNDAGYNSLLSLQGDYSNQITAIKSHPYYNEQNPVNKRRLDEQISEILVKKEEVSQRIANYDPSIMASGNGFQILGEWFGLSADQFKLRVFGAESILLEAVMLLCALYLSLTDGSSKESLNPTPPKAKKPIIPNFSMPKFTPPPGSFGPQRASDAVKAEAKKHNIPNIAEKMAATFNERAKEWNIPRNNNNIQQYKAPDLKHPLTFQLGHRYDDSDKGIYINLAESPHIVVAGGSGSGKSTLIKAITTQLIMKNPSKIKFLPVDLKKGATFFKFRNVPHLEKPLATNNYVAMKYLDYLLKEIDRRQDFLTANECEDIIEYSKEFGKLPFPFLVAIFEEIALLMQEDKKAADKLAKLTAIGRSAGVHAILCTQYPKAEVLNTRITANCLDRICFSMDKEAQSRVVLDEPGAERLQGSGHALFKHQRNLIEIQTPLYSKTEIQSVVDDAIQKWGKLDIPMDDGENIPSTNIIPFPGNIPIDNRNIPNIPPLNENIPENIPLENIPKVELVKQLYHQYGKRQTEIAGLLNIPQGTVSKLLRKDV